MNFIDLLLVITFFIYLANYSKRSFTYYVFSGSGLLVGFLLGLVLSPVAAKGVGSDLKKGILALVIISALAALFWLMGKVIGDKLRMQIIQSKLYRPDMLLMMPYKLFMILVLTILVAQTTMHIPILSIQYMAQGSSILYATNKIVPKTFVDGLAQKIAPDQFKNLHLEYDNNPMTYSNISDAGEFQQIVDDVAPSVVKVSGRTCVGVSFGSGFIVAPNYVMTNAHVVNGASTIYISDHSGAYRQHR